MKKDQERLEKQLAETQTEKRKLMEPLQKVHVWLVFYSEYLNTY